ncbi:MAG: cell division protein ZipA C-terminal FtsZ-binding domain-containing protein [Betaproteobacteria bacterium]
MSDLQIYLLGLGVTIILAVLIFNRFQERKYKNTLNKTAEADRTDPLLDQLIEDASSSELTHTDRDVASGEEAAQEVGYAQLTIDDSNELIDFVEDKLLELDFIEPSISFYIEITANEGLCISSTGRLQEVLSAIPKRYQVLGSNRKQKDAVIISNPDSVFDKLKIVIQLSDRNGALTKEQIDQIVADIYAESVPTGAIATQVDISLEAERAERLKAFGDEVDLLFGLTVERSRSVTMPGAEVKNLANSLGLRLTRAGSFIMKNKNGDVLFTMENRDSTPFIEADLDEASIAGITFLLDVPMVEDGIKTFNKMAGVAKQFADAMNASICDDNSQIVNDSGLDVIRQQLLKLYERMQEEGIPPGALAARQLFT